VEQVHAFRAELAQLETENVLRLHPDQLRVVGEHHDRLLAGLAKRFDVDLTPALRQMSIGMRIVSLLGAVALSAAVVLFFYRFWHVFSVPAQVALLASAPILTAIGAEIAARREKSLYFTSLLALVSFSAFVLDLNVVAAIFNLPPSSGGFLAWALFALAFAYAHRLRLLLLLGIGCAGIWVAATFAGLSGISWDYTVLRPEGFIVAGALALAAAWFEDRRRPPFAQIYRLLGCLAILLPMLALSEEGRLSYLPLGPLAVRRLYDVAGFALGVGGAWWAIRRRWAETLNAITLFLVAFLCMRMYDWCWDLLPRYLFFLLIGAGAVAVMVGLQVLRARAGASTAGREREAAATPATR
jgi:uncharacterized membrane protein